MNQPDARPDVFIIDYDTEKGRFIVAGPSWRFTEINKIPHRRWHKTARHWLVPAVSRNVDALQQNFGSASWTERARAALLDSTLTQAARARRHLKFPVDFPWQRWRDLTGNPNPWKHQIEALDMCYGNDANALFMEPRTGKCLVVVAWMSQLFYEGAANASLIIAPLSTRHNWKREIVQGCPFYEDGDVMLHDSAARSRAWLGRPRKFKWLIVSTESLSQGHALDIAREFLSCHTSGVSVDEGTWIKSHDANRSKAAVSLGRMGAPRALLNGELVTKGFSDLFMQYEFLDPAIIGIGDFFSFRNRYCVLGGYNGKQIVGYQNTEELMKLIGPYTFEKSKADTDMNLPKVVGPVLRTVRMTPEQKKAYDEIESIGITEINDELAGVPVSIEVKNVLERMLRFQQIVGGHISRSVPHPFKKKKDGTPVMVPEPHVLPGENPKLIELLNIIEQSPDSPTLIWARFRPEIAAIVNALEDRYPGQVAQYHGGIDETEREVERIMFQTGRKRFKVANQQTGGVGVDFSAARTVIYFSNTFSFHDRRQSFERPLKDAPDLHSVYYVDLIMEDTVDGTIMQSIADHQDMADYVRQAMQKFAVNALYRGQV